MKQNHFIGYLLLIIILFLVPVDSYAQDWWMTNSLKLDDLPEGTLFHAEGEYSFTHTTGNVDMYLHRGAPAVFLRNGRMLFNTFGNIEYQKIKVGDDPATRNRSFMINTKFIYDLVPVLQSETGILWERDEPHYIDRRVVLYTGMIYNVLENDHLGKMFFGAVGYQYATSTEFLPILPVTKEDKPIAYLQQQLVLKLFQPITFTESFTYIKELDEEAAHRTKFLLSAQIPVTSHVVFVVSHQTEYESEPIIRALAPYFEKLNTTFTLGVKLNF